MTDPLDKQLVEVALAGGGRRKADLEEAKAAGVRPRRSAEDEPLDDDDCWPTTMRRPCRRRRSRTTRSSSVSR
jgi:hypothetical protein